LIFEFLKVMNYWNDYLLILNSLASFFWITRSFWWWNYY